MSRRVENHVEGDLDLRAIAELLEGMLPAYLADLEMLVNLDSGTFDKAGVDRVGQKLRERYRQLGAEIKEYPSPVYGDTFVATLGGIGEGRVLLLGHLDTFYPLGTAAQRPFTIESERAYGPGSADMKSGNLCILYALDALRQRGFEDYALLTAVHNTDEEIGSPSSRELIRSEAERADAVLVLEAGRENGSIVSARKGVADFQLRVRGRSAHAGVNHDRGRSAALELAHLVVALESINGTVPGATLNVGRLEAGERPNVVPDHAFAHFEARAFEQHRLQEVIALVEQIVARRTVDGCEAEVRISVEHFPMHKSEGTARLVELAQLLARQLGFEIRDVATGGASDGNTAAAAGRPVLDGLGPIGSGAHSPSESIHIPSIVPRTALLTGLIAALGRRTAV